MASSTEHATGLAPVVSLARRLLNLIPSGGTAAASRSLPAPSRRAHLPLLAIVAALALALLVALAPLPARAERIVLASYQEREGLQNLTPTCLTQDRRAASLRPVLGKRLSAVAGSKRGQRDEVGRRLGALPGPRVPAASAATPAH